MSDSPRTDTNQSTLLRNGSDSRNRPKRSRNPPFPSALVPVSQRPDSRRVETSADFRPWRPFCVLVLIAVVSGCASRQYRCGSVGEYYTSPELAEMTDVQIERGRPNRLIDGFGWVWGIPAKIILFDRRIENHRIDARTEAEIAAYLNDNQLSTVKVRLNQYHPGDDWKRLVANKSVGAGWRYTLGALSVAGETVFPGRLFGADHYNPFTNTIHLYSNAPAIAFHEAGHARDFASRKWKGTYAAAYLVPGVPLYHEAVATGDAIGYVTATRDPAQQREAYNLLYPAYGTYVGSAFGGTGGVAYFAAVLAGHAAGRWKSSQVEDLPEEIQQSSWEAESR